MEGSLCRRDFALGCAGGSALALRGLFTALTIACGPADTAIALHISQIPLLANELRVQVDVDGQLSATVGSAPHRPCRASCASVCA